jgi:hypothetical protein
MKKFKILTNPANIDHIQLDDLDYNAAPIQEDKAVRLRARRWRKLRQQLL